VAKPEALGKAPPALFHTRPRIATEAVSNAGLCNMSLIKQTFRIILANFPKIIQASRGFSETCLYLRVLLELGQSTWPLRCDPPAPGNKSPNFFQILFIFLNSTFHYFSQIIGEPQALFNLSSEPRNQFRETFGPPPSKPVSIAKIE